MSYTPTTWATGDTITASAMNKIENGIANAGSGYDIVVDVGDAFVEEVTANEVTVDFDVDTIRNKIRSGMLVTGVCIRHYNYDEDIEGDTCLELFPLTEVNIYSDYGEASFSIIRYFDSNSTSLNVFFAYLHLSFDLTGAVTQVKGYRSVRAI